MSWDILPKSNLQYFLTKLKGIFDNKVDKETGKGLFSGNYNDLTNKPSIPAAANNNTITIQLNGVTVESFTLNQATDETINIQVTKSSVGLSNVGNFKAVSTEASQGLTDTEKANARANIGAGTSSTDQQVYQENTNANTDYRVLLGVESDITSYVYKSIGLRYNPGKDSVYTEKINDTVLGDAIGFDVQNSSDASDLTNGLLPTGQTIKSYLNSNIVADTGWKSMQVDSQYGSGLIFYRKSFGIVTVNLQNLKLENYTPNAGFTVATLPSGFLPKGMTLYRMYGNQGYYYIDTNGKIFINASTTSVWVGFNVSYHSA